MIKNGDYIFRLGNSSDQPARGYTKKEHLTFILEYQGRKIGVGQGYNCFIAHIEIFEKIWDMELSLLS